MRTSRSASTAISYLTGFPEPEAVLVIAQADSASRSLLFYATRSRARDLGRLPLRSRGRRENFGFDEAHSGDEARPDDPQAARRPAGAVLRRGRGQRVGRPPDRMAECGAAQVRSAFPRPEIRDVRKLLDEMRLIKDCRPSSPPCAAPPASRPVPTGARCGHASRTLRVRSRGRAAARIPRTRRAAAYTLDRRGRSERMRAALRGKRRAAARRRSAAHRCRLRARRLCVGHHPHISR